MARIYSRKRGKAGSKKPARKSAPNWIAHTPAVVEQLVIKLAKSEKTTSQIGAILRDTYGIPEVRQVTGKKITQILKDNNQSPKLPENLAALIRRHIQLMKHILDNKRDEVAARGETITESKINRLVKYYKRTGLLPENWTYDKTKAKLLVSG